MCASPVSGWNGVTAWPLLVLHAFGSWDRFPVYNLSRDGGLYQFGFLIGATSPFLGTLGTRAGRKT